MRPTSDGVPVGPGRVRPKGRGWLALLGRERGTTATWLTTEPESR
ncbi:MAG: hypothetical protein WAL35_02895 [Acidimicrobiales bacterium]